MPLRLTVAFGRVSASARLTALVTPVNRTITCLHGPETAADSSLWGRLESEARDPRSTCSSGAVAVGTLRLLTASAVEGSEREGEGQIANYPVIWFIPSRLHIKLCELEEHILPCADTEQAIGMLIYP
jgi:hypothetical protein